jgi:hypothetical protein
MYRNIWTDRECITFPEIYTDSGSLSSRETNSDDGDNTYMWLLDYNIHMKVLVFRRYPQLRISSWYMTVMPILELANIRHHLLLSQDQWLRF